MKYSFALALIWVLGACQPSRQASAADFEPVYTTGPRALVYKTRNDYDQQVPVLLSEDKSAIVSYPAPQDVAIRSGYPMPTKLKDGYLLDNKGINQHVAFLSLTYAQYAALDTLPSLQALYDMIIDKDPLEELCDCGDKIAYSDIETQLNALIRQKKLRSTCKPLR